MSHEPELKFTGADKVVESGFIGPDTYHQFTLGLPNSFYARRLELAGATNFEHVLDAGCGYGQWAVELSKVNAAVTAVDRSDLYIKAAKLLAEQNGRTNIEFGQEDLHELQLEDGSFDFIWCWGVIMFTDRARVFPAFHRLLKPGGRMFLGCCNGPGRWLNKFFGSLNPLDRRLFLKRPRMKSCLRACFKGNKPGVRPNSFRRATIQNLSSEYGFRVLDMGFDGQIGMSNGRSRFEPLFKKRFLGLENNLEFLLERD